MALSSGFSGPVRCVDLELAAPPVPHAATDSYVLVRLHGHPLGFLEIDAARMAVDGGASLAREVFDDEVRKHLAADRHELGAIHDSVACHADSPEYSAFVTVIVCTLGQEPRLPRTIDSVLAQSHRDLELVVVDNSPSTGAVVKTLKGFDDPRLRIISEPCRGLSAARNAGVASARGSIIAFTDDDATADPQWLRHLCGAFGDAQDVVAVTGLVVPDELETPAQRLFEEFGGFDKGFERTLWSARDSRLAGVPYVLGDRGALFPYSAGVYGSGNNMAFRAEWLRGTALFDEALGAGSITRGGEDLDAFLTVMLAGKALVYEPAALVRHSARRSMADLESQLNSYGSGNSAAITKHALASPSAAMGILARVPAGLRRMVDPASEKNARRSADYPKTLTRAELKGFAAGPLLYVRGRREAQRRRAVHPLGTSAGPYSIVQFDVDDPAATVPHEGGHEAVWVIVRRGGVPQAIVQTTRSAAAADLARLDPAAGAAPLDNVPDSALPFATVVVCSIVSRAADLRRCLAQLEALIYADVEILLVDNRPSLPGEDPLPGILADHPRVRVVRCPTPGLSAARNVGIRASSGEIIAFTDDDTLVDPTWLRAIGRRFVAEPTLDAVTGLILPAELESPAQVYFERYYGGFAGVRSYRRLTAQGGGSLVTRARVVVRDESGDLIRHMPVYGVGAFGAGANMAFRRAVLLRLGGFDELLGLGTPSKGGEDLAILMRLLWTGGALGYEPAAAIAHRHRVEYDELMTQMGNYGLGYTAALTSLVWRDPRHLLGLGVLAAPATRDFAVAATRRVSGTSGPSSEPTGGGSAGYPRELFVRELRGLPHGPTAYLRSIASSRRRPSESR